MKKTRLIVLIVLAVFLLTLCSCGAKDADAPGTDGKGTDTTATPTPTPDAPATATATPTPTPEPEDEAVEILVEISSGSYKKFNMALDFMIPAGLSYTIEDGEEYAIDPEYPQYPSIVTDSVIINPNIRYYGYSNVFDANEWKAQKRSRGYAEELFSDVTLGDRPGVAMFDEESNLYIVASSASEIDKTFGFFLIIGAKDGTTPVDELFATPEIQAIISSAAMRDTDAGDGSTITVEKGDVGKGPITLDTRFADITIPAGLSYKVYTHATETENGTVQIDFGMNDPGSGYILVSTTRMIDSLDTAVAECIRMNDFGTGESEILGDYTFNGVAYKLVNIITEYSNKNYLVSYFVTAEGQAALVEVSLDNGNYNSSGLIAYDDALLAEMLNAVVFK